MAFSSDAPARDRLEAWAGWLSLAAGAVHGAVAPAHFAEWLGYGLFFVFAAAAQVLFGLLLLTRAINPDDTGPSYLRWKRALYVAGIVGNVAIVGVYAVSRTIGVPWFGPEAGEVETVGAIDVVSKGIEVALVVVLVPLHRRSAPATASLR